MPSAKNKVLEKEKPKKPFKRKARKLFQYAPEQLERALEEINGKRIGIREASRQFNIPKTTIIDRLKGRVKVARRKTGPECILTAEVEKKIVDWIINIAKCGFPLKKTDLLNTVQKIAEETGKTKFFKDGRPGQKWYKQFMKRHPELSFREAESINKARAVVTEQYVRGWFDELQIFLEENGLMEILDDPSRVFNGDESGFSLCPKSGKVLAPRGWKNLYQIKLGSEKENLTVLIVFSADGVICPPLVVFPYIRPPRVVVDSMPPDWILGRSESGWMKSEVFFEYIANDFNKWVTEKQIKRPIILFIDGHKSHMTLALSEFCDSNGIILYALPPNTTHMLQPADVSVFRPLKNEWQKTVRNWQKRPENTNKCVTKSNFCQVFNETLCNSNMKDHIINGFRKCRLCPLNPNNVDFTKCVKNFQETHQTNHNTNEEDIMPDEWITAKKVISRIAPTLTEYGINIEVILNEINERANIGPPPKKQNLLQVGEIVPFGDVTIIPIDTVRLELNLTQPTSTVSESTLQGTEVVGHLEDQPFSPADTSLQVTGGSSPNDQMFSLGRESILPDTNENPTNNNSPNHLTFPPASESNLQEEDENPPSEQPSTPTLEATLQQMDENPSNMQIFVPSSVEKNPLQSILDNHLFLPQPIESTNKRIKDNFPSAISSKAWRMKLAMKEMEKNQKEEEAKRKREEKRAQANNRTKRNDKKKKEKFVKHNKNDTPARTGNLQCSACDEELISDVEDEDEKNIGCDKCPRWFHMRCTEFIGMSYDMVIDMEYLCYMCS